MYLIQACPLARIFIPKYWKWLLEDEARIFDDKSPFEVNIHLANGDENFKYLTPRLMVPPKKEFQDDYNAKIYWLTGSDAEGNQNAGHESDCYGVVKFTDGKDYMAQMIATLGSKNSKEAQKKIKEAAAPDIEAALEVAKKQSYERVMKAVRQTYRNLKSQYEKSQEIGIGKHAPTAAEYFCGIILANENKEKAEKEKQFIDRFNNLEVPNI